MHGLTVSSFDNLMMLYGYMLFIGRLNRGWCIHAGTPDLIIRIDISSDIIIVYHVYHARIYNDDRNHTHAGLPNL